ncbi:L-rhamnose mutarotase [Ruminococcus sp. OA3]|uniref:L-rhamnose mutarotase n=1 Tax=Ruminococcus sp. OA3 TaxID=2914164 RepID=UPI001F06F2D0|nr:L-rhamnose mutarotase [Ruminococcus sp. OA3]MCH1982393.1 L-rhamnose mutarotase [Ruminococcus sp. OA3]
MTRKAYVYKLKPGMKEEYRKRHDNIWPELSRQMTKKGIHNYTIWFYDNNLFAYYELDKDAFAVPSTEEEIQLESRWAEHTGDLIEAVTDPETGEALELECVFFHE